MIQSLTAWQRAYVTALLLSALSVGLALLVWAFGVESRELNIIIASLLGIVGVYCGGRMIAAGGALAAFPYFLTGAGIFFGFGTVIAAYSENATSALSFTPDAHRVALAKLNAANAVAVFVVVAFAGPCFFWLPTRKGYQPGLNATIAAIQPYRKVLLTLSAPIVLLMWLTFAGGGGLLFASVMAVLGGVPLFTIMISAASWPSLSGWARTIVVGLVVALALHGTLGLSKLQGILPIVILGLGWWVSGQMQRRALILCAVLGAVYFGGFANLIGVSRLHVNYDPVRNSPAERVDILVGSTALLRELQEKTSAVNLLDRLSIAPFQLHFMNLYDGGIPGDSLEEIPIVLIPRAIWPDKPLISPGAEFDLIFRGYESESHLALGFVTESYWNQGWLGVIFVSAYIGLATGWFTRKWLLFAQHGWPHIGAFLFSPLIVLGAVTVEKNIAGGYVGGTIKLAITIMLVDLIARAVMAQIAIRQSA